MCQHITARTTLAGSHGQLLHLAVQLTIEAVDAPLYGTALPQTSECSAAGVRGLSQERRPPISSNAARRPLTVTRRGRDPDMIFTSLMNIGSSI